MVYKLCRIASKVVTLNSILRHAERRVLLNTFHKARSNSTVAWPPPKLLKRYSLFQMDNNLPVYIKGGFTDKFLYNSTLALIAIGLIDGFYTLVTMALPKKK
ncbi:hypothetical protein Trydic_g9595 [Trypoxylus dichotomus]